MPRSCVAPGCTEGYGSKKSTFSFFSAPKDPVKRSKWQAAIPRVNFELKAGQVLCERHFMPHDIVRKKQLKDGNGKVVKEPLLDSYTQPLAVFASRGSVKGETRNM
ncbi:THAP domain-containing protein 2-like [Ischnura elegans]|uniref:THAP domain-containing protein 2-like n=1 Tax=Ischnura elegans TaxID=197161 RepID=UPI001ED8899E|nr:THAP domain-containing protein 2-like [Ischnura elegans]